MDGYVDHARRGRAARRKGSAGELEVRDLLREYGFEHAHRNFMSGGAGGGDLADAIPNVHIECKRTENLVMAGWWKQALSDARPTDLVVVVHRGSYQPWQATGHLCDLAPLFAFHGIEPLVIGRTNPRPEFLADLHNTMHPCVVHRCGLHPLMTVLFTDFLDWQRDQCTSKAA